MRIDFWTLGIQTINVVILVWLLGRFFWRPLAAMIAQRQVLAQQMLAEAAAKRGEAEAALAEIARTRAGFAQERAAILASAHEAAEQARTARLAEAARQAASLEAAANARIGKDQEAAAAAWAEQAAQLAIDIAQRLAARLDGPAVHGAFLRWLLTEIRQMPEAAREAARAPGAVLQAVSAAPLAAADQAQVRQALAEAFGGHPEIGFAVDPALIAGLELRGPHLLVRNSWRADLTRILADIAHDHRS